MTVTTNTGAGTVTMANGIVTAVISISTAQILTLTYQGYQVTTGGNSASSAFYWQGQNSIGEQTGEDGILTVVTNPANNSGSSGEIMIADLYSNHTTTTDSPDDAYHYFTMFRGSPGIYVTEVMARPAAPNPAGYPAGKGTYRASPASWAAIFLTGSPRTRPGQNVLMPTSADLAAALSGVNAAPKEVTRLTTGLLDGWFDCKYDYAGDLGP